MQTENEYKDIPDEYWVDAGNGYEYAVRKLTERECFRLQGVKDKDIDKMYAYREYAVLKNGQKKEIRVSKTAMYKAAGNSISTEPMFHFFRKMFLDTDMEPIGDAPKVTASRPLTKTKPQPIQPSLFDFDL